MSLKFSEAMYVEMEDFVGRRQIFGRASDVVDSDRVAPPVARQYGHSTPASREPAFVGLRSPIPTATAAFKTPSTAIPRHDTCGSTGRKRKAVGVDNLVDFVKYFNHEYLTRVEAQDIEKWTWKTDVLGLDTAREARIARKELQAASMDQFFFELEVERTKNLGSMTTALLMLATSMNTLTRLCFRPPFLKCHNYIHNPHPLPWCPMWLAF